jgi:hypothetical protein
VDVDLTRNLDLLNVLRRLKMHGLALSVLLDGPAIKFISRTSLTKPLDFVIENTARKPTILWSRLELLSRYERIMISIYRRYVRIVNDETA